MSCRAPDTRGHAGCAAGSQPDALPAMPRKTTSARFSRNTLASSSAPSRAASFDRRTVVTLSTMIRLSAPSPLPSSSSTSSRNCGASVRVHERLIVLGRLTRRERPRLPVRLRGKPFRHHIRNPETIGTAQSKIAHYPSAAKSGNATKRLRLRGDVPGYTPGDAGLLAETLAQPGTKNDADVHLDLAPVWSRRHPVRSRPHAALPDGQHEAQRGRRHDRGQVTDGGYVKAGQACEDVADAYQDSEDSQGRDPG